MVSLVSAGSWIFLIDKFAHVPNSFCPGLGYRVVGLAGAVFHSSEEGSSVYVAFRGGLLSLACHLSLVELSFVGGLFLGVEELSLALSDSIVPGPFVDVSVAIHELSWTVLLALGEGAVIDASVG